MALTQGEINLVNKLKADNLPAEEIKERLASARSVLAQENTVPSALDIIEQDTVTSGTIQDPIAERMKLAGVAGDEEERQAEARASADKFAPSSFRAQEDYKRTAKKLIGGDILGAGENLANAATETVGAIAETGVKAGDAIFDIAIASPLADAKRIYNYAAGKGWGNFEESKGDVKNYIGEVIKDDVIDPAMKLEIDRRGFAIQSEAKKKGVDMTIEEATKKANAEVNGIIDGGINWYQNLDDVNKANVKKYANIAMFGLDIATLGQSKTATGALKEGLEEGTELATRTGFKTLDVGSDLIRSARNTGRELVDNATGLLARNTDKIDDIVKEADIVIRPDMTDAQKASITAKQSEAGLPKLTSAEERASISPTTKKYIMEEPEKARTYLDQAIAAKADPKGNIGALGYGSERVKSVRDSAVAILDDTGSDIGKFRLENAKKPVLVEDMVKLENSIVDDLDKINLEVTADKVAQIPGRQATASASEIKELQTIWDNYRVLDETPTMKELIEFRDNVTRNIKFAKSSQQVSGNLDQMMKNIRGNARQANINIIPSDQAQLLDDYSELITAINELNSFVDKKAGGEFLLKRVLSERDRAPKELFNILKKYTGDDLYNDAVFAQLAVSLVDDPRQLGLFRQEIGKGAADAAISAVTGSKIQAVKSAYGAIESLFTPTQREAYEAIMEQSLKGVDDIPISSFNKVGATKSANVLDDIAKPGGLSSFRKKDANFMIASAENPMGEVVNNSLNVKMTEAFDDMLTKNNISHKLQNGVYGSPEKSYLIQIDTPSQRSIIDKWLETNSPQAENILIKDGKAYRYDPRTFQAMEVDLQNYKGDLVKPSTSTDMYSEIDGKKYQLPLYDDTLEKNSVNFIETYNK